MLKKLLLILLVIIAIIAGSVFLINNRKKEATVLPPQTENHIESSTLSDLPNDWQTYTSPEFGFSINHPFDMKIELTQGGVHFLKLGPTQSMGTELFDGLSLLIYTAKLPHSSFDGFVQNEYKKVKNDQIYTQVSSLEKASVSTFSGYRFDADGIGKSTNYYLKNDNDSYIKITDMTVEPQNSKSNFHKTVSQMLNTFQSSPNSTTTTSDGESSKLERAIKDYAAHDLNVVTGEVTIQSIKQMEWPNSCLGLEKQGEMCAQMIVPGYQITVQANGREKIYRTNSDGSVIIIEK